MVATLWVFRTHEKWKTFCRGVNSNQGSGCVAVGFLDFIPPPPINRVPRMINMCCQDPQGPVLNHNSSISVNKTTRLDIPKLERVFLFSSTNK